MQLAPVINDPRSSHNADKDPIPTDDREVKSHLQHLGAAATLSNESPESRRERLRQLVSQTNGTAAEEPQLHAPNVEMLSSDEEDDDEEFYTPGSEELLHARKHILETSFRNAHVRISAQETDARGGNQARTLKHRRHVNSVLRRYELTDSITLAGNSRAISAVKSHRNLVGCSSWDGNVYFLRKDDSQYTPVAKTGQGHHMEKAIFAWHPYTSHTVSGGAEGSLCFWPEIDNLETAENAANSTAGHVINPVESTTAHTARVAAVDFHVTGKYFATASFDSTWKLWDYERRTELLHQEGHAKAVYGCKFHPDGSLLATAGLDSINRVWDLRSGRSIAVFGDHTQGIYSSDWLPNGYHLATAGGDGAVKIWDLRKGENVLFSIPAHSKLVSGVRFMQRCETSPLSVQISDENDENPKTLDSSGTFLVTSSYDRTVKVWSADNWIHLTTLAGHIDKVMACDISEDGTELYSCGWDRTLRVWSDGERSS